MDRRVLLARRSEQEDWVMFEKNKVGRLHAICAGLAIIGCLGVTGMGISIVNSLANDSMAEVMAADNKANNYIVTLQDEADRLADELSRERDAELEKAIADAEQRSKDALDEHEKHADDRFDKIEGMLAEGDGESDPGTDSGMSTPMMGEEGFNEP